MEKKDFGGIYITNGQEGNEEGDESHTSQLKKLGRGEFEKWGAQADGVYDSNTWEMKKRILIIVGGKSYKKENHRLRILIQGTATYKHRIVGRKERPHHTVAGVHRMPVSQQGKQKAFISA